MRTWKVVAVIAGVLAVGAVAAVALAWGDDDGTGAGRQGRHDRAGLHTGSGSGVRFGQSGSAREQVSNLTIQHKQEMQAWANKYANNLSSPEAQRALAQLHAKHRGDTSKLRVASDGYGSGMMRRGAGTCSGSAVDSCIAR